MVYARRPISNSSSSLTKPGRIVLSVPITTGITVISIFGCCFFFFVLWQGLSICLIFTLIFTLWSAETANSTIWQVLVLFFSLFNNHYVWSSGRDGKICFYLKIPENFVRLIHWDGFWFIHMLYSHDHYTYTYTYTRRNIFNTIRTSEDTSLEKYTSHFIERVVCER